METRDRKDQKPDIFKVDNFRSGRTLAGLIIIIVGSALLARQIGVEMPYWLFSWKTMLIAIGLYVGAKHNFRNMSWMILVAIGTVFLMEDLIPDISIAKFAWPIIIICVGLVMILRPRQRNKDNAWKNWGNSGTTTEATDDDFLDSTTLFGSMKKKVITKNFKGGDVTNVFGGTELNLMQADLDSKAVLDVTQIFGGTKLLVPAHWKLKTDDLVTIFGGIEDKRPIQSDPNLDSNKVLVLTGTCIFGGIDIKSY